MKTKQQIIDKRQELIFKEVEKLSKKYKKFNVGRDLTPRTWGKIKALTWVLDEEKGRL